MSHRRPGSHRRSGSHRSAGGHRRTDHRHTDHRHSGHRRRRRRLVPVTVLALVMAVALAVVGPGHVDAIAEMAGTAVSALSPQPVPPHAVPVDPVPTVTSSGEAADDPGDVATGTDGVEPTPASLRSLPTPRPEAPRRLRAKDPATLVWQVETDDPVVFLTLDDGAVTDPRLLDFLARRQIPTTTFLTTSTVTEGWDFWRSMLDLGSIQDHTVSHPTLPGLGTAGAAEQICGASEAILEGTGTRPWMLRPPYGRYDTTTLAAAGQCGIDYVVMWNVSLPGKFLRYQSGDRLQPGDIILSHYRSDLVPHLKRALAEVEARGLRVARLEDYLRPRN